MRAVWRAAVWRFAVAAWRPAGAVWRFAVAAWRPAGAACGVEGCSLLARDVAGCGVEACGCAGSQCAGLQSGRCFDTVQKCRSASCNREKWIFVWLKLRFLVAVQFGAGHLLIRGDRDPHYGQNRKFWSLYRRFQRRSTAEMRKTGFLPVVRGDFLRQESGKAAFCP